MPSIANSWTRAITFRWKCQKISCNLRCPSELVLSLGWSKPGTYFRFKPVDAFLSIENTYSMFWSHEQPNRKLKKYKAKNFEVLPLISKSQTKEKGSDYYDVPCPHQY